MNRQSQSRSSQKKSIILILITFLFIFIIAFVLIYFWWQAVQKPANPNLTQSQKIIIPKGSGVIAIGDLLEEQGIVKSSLAFRILVDRKDYASKLQAGSYELSPSQKLSDVIESLTKGVEDFWVTIPEGKRREEIAYILATEYANQGLDFAITDFIEASDGLEGYLFPDTYLLPRTMTAQSVVNLMHSTFDLKVPDDLKIQASNFGLTFQQVLILASLIEREAKFPIDRPMIAGVLHNRLKIDMPLQIDATVQYAVGQNSCQHKVSQDCNWWPVINSTTFSSEYNTYQHPGLPPEPICNPGLSVIQAVLNPDNHDFLYYLSEPSGKTHYSQTLAEHNQKIQQYLN